MAGNKNSGRKSNYESARIGELEDISVDWLLNNWDSFDNKTKITLASKLAANMQTRKSESKTEITKKEEQVSLIGKMIRDYSRENKN